jgi:anti-sigma factor RsiW
MEDKNHHPDPDLLQGYLDQVLENQQQQELEEHLAGCRQCRSLLHRLESLAARLENLPELTLERDLSPVILARLRERKALSPGLAVTLAVEALAAGAAIGVLIPLIRAADWLPQLRALWRGLPTAASIFLTQLASSWIYWWFQLKVDLKALFEFRSALSPLPASLPAPWILVLAAVGLGLALNWLLLRVRPQQDHNHTTHLD